MCRRGGTTIEFLITLLVSCMLLPIVYIAMRLLISHEYFNQNAQDEIALYQLRQILLLVDNISITNDGLSGMLYDEEIRVVYNNKHLYLQPGTQIFITDIEEGYFSNENGLYFFNYLRGNTWMKRVLTNG